MTTTTTAPTTTTPPVRPRQRCRRPRPPPLWRRWRFLRWRWWSGGAGRDGGTTPRRPDGSRLGAFLAASLRGPDVVSWAVPGVATNTLLALLLVLLMPFPGELFNRTLDEHYDEVTGWFAGWCRGAVRSVPGERRSRVRGSWRTLGLVLVAGTLLAGLSDPGFGWNRSTGALLVGAGLGLIGVMAVGLGVSAWFVRRRETVCRRRCGRSPVRWW